MPIRHSDFVVYSEGLGSRKINSINSSRFDQMKTRNFAALDAILEGINTRYYQTDIGMLKSVEKILLAAANKDPHPVEDFTKITEAYRPFFDPKV